MPDIPRPPVGLIVHYYTAPDGAGPYAAAITATTDTLEGNGWPPLTADEHVHLYVFLLDYPAHRTDVPHGTGPGTWSWPPRV